jgi:hypothetical protein
MITAINNHQHRFQPSVPRRGTHESQDGSEFRNRDEVITVTLKQMHVRDRMPAPLYSCVRVHELAFMLASATITATTTTRTRATTRTRRTNLLSPLPQVVVVQEVLLQLQCLVPLEEPRRRILALHGLAGNSFAAHSQLNLSQVIMSVVVCGFTTTMGFRFSAFIHNLRWLHKSKSASTRIRMAESRP